VFGFKEGGPISPHLVKGCPAIAGGSSIDVYETFEIM